MVTRKTHEEICWMKSIMSLVKNKQKFKSSKSEYYKLNPKSSPTFSVRPRSSVGRVTVGRGFDSHRGQNIFSLPRVVPCFPLLGLTPCGLFMGLSSTLIYTSELILCFTICVPSATRHNIRYTPVAGPPMRFTRMPVAG